jgi:hypothetical protein
MVDISLGNILKHSLLINDGIPKLWVAPLYHGKRCNRPENSAACACCFCPNPENTELQNFNDREWQDDISKYRENNGVALSMWMYLMGSGERCK